LAGDEFGDTLISKFMGRKILVRNLIDKAFREKTNSWTDNIDTKEKEESLEELIVKSFHQTIETLIKNAGDNPAKWRWSDYHTLTLKHPLGQKKILDKVFDLNRGPFHVGGSYHTVCPYSYSYNNPYIVNHGASHRQIYNLADWDDSWSVIPTGNSGIPASKHYCDQTSDYINKKYHPDLFNQEIIKQNKQYKMKFIPKPQ
jgi:penicillin amidase